MNKPSINAPDEVLQKFAYMTTQFPSEINILKTPNNFPPIALCIEDKLDRLAKRGELLLPNLSENNKSIVISSDYGGEHTDSKYISYSFLFCAYTTLWPFQIAQQELRKKFGLDNPIKEIAFKSIGYGPQDKALHQYLLNLNNFVCGILITIVIEKNTISFWGNNKKEGQALIDQTLKEADLNHWKPQIAEKAINVIHIVCYFIALLGSESQNILWQIDQDATLGSSDQVTGFGKLFGRILSMYTSKKFGEIKYCQTFGKENLLLLDLLSASDLAAGSIEHYLTRKKTQSDLTIKNGANEVLMWHAYQGIGLKKYAFSFRPGNTGQFESATLEFNPLVEPQS